MQTNLLLLAAICVALSGTGALAADIGASESAVSTTSDATTTATQSGAETIDTAKPAKKKDVVSKKNVVSKMFGFLKKKSATKVQAQSAVVEAAEETMTKAELKETLGDAAAEHAEKGTGIPTKQDVDTARSMSNIPGVNIRPEELATVPDAEKKGFNPLRWLFGPVEDLQRQSLRLEQQIMRLEGPIAGLQPSMVGLQDKMTGVQGQMGKMHDKLSSVQGDVTGVRTGMSQVGNQMHGVRGDLLGMRQQIVALQAPIQELRAPIARLEQPIIAVQRPISGVQSQLSGLHEEINDLKLLLSTVLLAIFVAAGATAIGTPIAAVLVYKNRRKLFPDMREKDFPVAKAPRERVGTKSSK